MRLLAKKELMSLAKILPAIALMILISALMTGCGGTEYKHLTHEEAQRLLAADQNVILLDVRKPDEYEKKHIPNAVLLPIEELRAGNFSALPDKDRTIITYCWTGRRAQDAAEILTDAGYTKVYEMGGIVDWKGSVVGTEIN